MRTLKYRSLKAQKNGFFRLKTNYYKGKNKDYLAFISGGKPYKFYVAKSFVDKTKIFTWTPLFIGVILLMVAKVNMIMFESQTLSVHDMLSREVPIVFIGLVVSSFVFISSLYWLYNKNGKMALQAVVSPILFLVCMSAGGVMGAAYLNAT